MSGSPKRAAKRRPSFLVRLAKGLYITLFILSLIVVAGYAALNIFAPKPTVDQQVTIPPKPAGPSAPPAVTDSPDATPGSDHLVLNRREDVFTCLLLGVADQGGTDTIMLGVFDTKAKQASLISIPRDTVVYQNGKYRKINSTYAGGEEAVVEAVRDLLGIPVDYWVSVNLKAFSEIVNQIGGVYFDVPVDMDYEDPYQDLYIHIPAGYQLLNGKKAEGVMRCRSCYASADIGRTATQRAFLVALAKQTITPSNVGNVTSLINTFSKYVRSNMSLNEMVWFGTQAIGMDLDTALTTGSLEGEWISPYWQLDDKAVLDMVNGLGIYQEQVPARALHIVHP
mgnify:CR=1 FL=1